MDITQARSLAQAAGFTGQGLDIILAIAQAESGLDPKATNTAGNTPPSTDRGILQINSYWHPEVADSCAFDPACAFEQGYRISQQGTDFTPWSTYTNGAYKRFLGGSMNIPSNDPGAFVLPYATTFCEWLVTLNGQVATCVESSEMIVDHMVTRGAIPVSAQEDITLTQELQKLGQAGAGGATDYLAASQQMTRLGIPNVAYGADWFSKNDFVPVVQAALKRGVPVLFGVYAAHNLYDDWTKQPEDAGVNGHGITLVGMDSTGAIVADPNTAQAKTGDFVHYTWADLKAAGGSFPSMVIPEASMPLDISTVSNYFQAEADGSWKCTQTGHSIAHGMLDFFRSRGFCDSGLPLTDEFPVEAGVTAQVFERTIQVYDPQRTFDSPPGATGSCYLGHIDNHKLNMVLQDPTLAKELADAQAALAAAQAQVAGLTQELANVSTTPSTDPAIKTALTAVSQLLTPFASAAGEVADALKKVA